MAYTRAADGTRLHYEVLGRSSATPVLMIQGLGADKHGWNMQRFPLALSEAGERPVRFVGRPDIAPLGPLLRRLGGLLAQPADVLGALRHHEIVIVSAAPTAHPRHAGAVPHELVGPAVIAGVPVFPLATMSSSVSRIARAEVGPQVRPRKKRRGPLAEVELAEQVQHHLQRMLDGFGGVQTGVAPLDWLAEG